MIKYYVNLTNGIEVIPDIRHEYRFVRIQSTACEQKRWNFLIQDLDNDLLMNLALGNTCIVYDYSRKGRSRAVWHGIEFIKYTLSLYWLEVELNPISRSGMGLKNYFHSIYNRLDTRTLKKLKYFTKFLLTNEIKLLSCSKLTDKDGQYEWYKKVLQEHQTNPTGG